MKLKPRTILRIILIIIVIALFIRNYVLHRDISRARQSESSLPSANAPLVKATRNLSQDDLLGGHTLKRHVGKTNEELRNRLEHERISAASTYTDRSTAERTVAAAIRANEDKVRGWLNQKDSHPNLVLDYDAAQSIGKTLRRGASASVPCSHAVVVLSWIESTGATLPPDSSYYVLTSYPQCGIERE